MSPVPVWDTELAGGSEVALRLICWGVCSDIVDVVGNNLLYTLSVYLKISVGTLCEVTKRQQAHLKQGKIWPMPPQE